MLDLSQYIYSNATRVCEQRVQLSLTVSMRLPGISATLSLGFSFGKNVSALNKTNYCWNNTLLPTPTSSNQLTMSGKIDAKCQDDKTSGGEGKSQLHSAKAGLQTPVDCIHKSTLLPMLNISLLRLQDPLGTQHGTIRSIILWSRIHNPWCSMTWEYHYFMRGVREGGVITHFVTHTHIS